MCTLINILFSEMGQRFKNHCRLALFSLMFLTVVRGARDILTETCEDRHGADLNGKLYSSILSLTNQP